MNPLKLIHPATGLVLLLATIAIASNSNADCPYDWKPGDGHPGLDGNVRAMAVFDDGSGPALFLGGNFSTAEDVAVNNIVKWDGQNWSALGDGTNGPIDSLLVFNNELIAAGAFGMAGGQIVHSIARWNGVNWAPLGTGMDLDVSALVEFNGELVAGGAFRTAGSIPTGGVARWNGTSWSAFGLPSLYTSPWRVYALAVYGGQLFAGGAFDPFSNPSYSGVARWNGSSWQSLGQGLSVSGIPTVNDFAILDQRLVAVGRFGVGNGVALWNGSAWTPLGQDLPQSSAGASAALALNGELLVAGNFLPSDGIPTHSVLRWDGAAWAPLGSGFYTVHGFPPGVLVLGSFHGEAYAGGAFSVADGSPASNLARWNGSKWTQLGDGRGLDSWVHALVVHDGELFAAGRFAGGSGTLLKGIARWAKTGWTSVGGGVSNPGRSTVGYSLTSYENELIVGGDFTLAGDVASRNVARWDGARWAPLGTGVSGQAWSMGVNNGDLFVGGTFSTAGGIPAPRIATWNGTAWGNLCQRANGTPCAGIQFAPNAFQVFQGDLIVGGTSDHGPQRIAAWNGSRWLPVGGGIPVGEYSGVLALAEFNGNLIVAGSFREVDGIVVDHIAAWDGLHWSSLGGGTNDAVNALAIYQGELIAAGNFTLAGATQANRIAKWNGSQWAPMGGGLDAQAFCLAIHDGDLIVGGRFMRAGDHISARVARWGPIVVPASISNHPSPQSVHPGKTATFSVLASGEPPLTYQWRKNGINLTDDQHISGATTATLTIRPVRPKDLGNYDVIVTNDCRSVTSTPAPLTLQRPAAN